MLKDNLISRSMEKPFKAPTCSWRKSSFLRLIIDVKERLPVVFRNPNASPFVTGCGDVYIWVCANENSSVVWVTGISNLIEAYLLL